MGETKTSAVGEPEYLDPTRLSRLLVIAEILVIPLGMFGVFVLAYWLLRSGTSDCRAACDQLLQGSSFFFAVGFTSLFIATRALRRAWLIWRSQQVPAPAESVFFRRKIERGQGARAHAYGSLVTALTFLGLVIWLVLTIGRTGNLLAPCG